MHDLINKIFNEDCLEGMKRIPDKSIDMVLCDMPYGKTACKWDVVIDLEKMWIHINRIIKKNSAVILTSAQPFTSILVCSNLKMFKYDWIWKKNKGVGHLYAKNQPLKDKEDILVFYKNKPTYNPQFTIGKPFGDKKGPDKISANGSECYGKYKKINYPNKDGKRYPKQVIEFKVVERTIHPTQKPIALMEYLIKTYSNEGDTVLDFCMGSGTTAIAAINTKRNYIGFEKDKTYYDLSLDRIKSHLTN
jgi:DNA modification methylase